MEIRVIIATAPETWGQDVTDEQVPALADRYEELIVDELASRYPEAEVSVNRQPYNAPGQRVRVLGSDDAEEIEGTVTSLLDDWFVDPRIWETTSDAAA